MAVGVKGVSRVIDTEMKLRRGLEEVSRFSSMSRVQYNHAIDEINDWGSLQISCASWM